MRRCGPRPGRPLLVASMVVLAAIGSSPPTPGIEPGCPFEHGADDAPVSSRLGQALWSALAEAVSRLEDTPEVDWTRVDLDALREHLLDMDALMTETTVDSSPAPNGVELRLRGTEAGLAAARRMVPAHGRAVVDRGWSVQVSDDGPGLRILWTTAHADEVVRLRALGFYGLMVSGDHHARHHAGLVLGHPMHAPPAPSSVDRPTVPPQVGDRHHDHVEGGR